MRSFWPDIEKFVPLPVCYGMVLLVIGVFVAVLIVIATSRRRDREDEAKN